MKSIEHYRSQFIAYLERYNQLKRPENLYAPIQYILSLGGKRLRPTLTLITTDCFGGDVSNALDAALAIEVFHNFSLVHDDIMDNAPLRRGQKTVHEKWNLNTGILSGDAMLIMAYKLFQPYDAKKYQQLCTLFSSTALKVCEGQQYDIDFETRRDVRISEYLTMIEYKTAVLVAAAMEMGAIVAEAPLEAQKKCYDFGKNLGIAFQLQDDYLDAFGDPLTFGKQVGGDIIENKKTFLFLKALELGTSADVLKLKNSYTKSLETAAKKIQNTLEIFRRTGAAKATSQAIHTYTKAAFDILESLDMDPIKKQQLRSFGTKLMTRTS